jgi:hypothetical protein
VLVRAVPDCGGPGLACSRERAAAYPPPAAATAPGVQLCIVLIFAAQPIPMLRGPLIAGRWGKMVPYLETVALTRRSPGQVRQRELLGVAGAPGRGAEERRNVSNCDRIRRTVAAPVRLRHGGVRRTYGAGCVVTSIRSYLISQSDGR